MFDMFDAVGGGVDDVDGTVCTALGWAIWVECGSYERRKEGMNERMNEWKGGGGDGVSSSFLSSSSFFPHPTRIPRMSDLTFGTGFGICTDASRGTYRPGAGARVVGQAVVLPLLW